MSELDKLEAYLKEHGIQYERYDGDAGIYARHYIAVPSFVGWEWDAICQWGSYGYMEGLLEISGELISKDFGDTDAVRGFLTAEDVIKRIEIWRDRSNGRVQSD